MDDEHRGVKLHVQFHACKGVPGDAELTPAACSEPEALTSMLEVGRLYVCDRGYASFELFRSILDAGSSLIVSLLIAIRTGAKPTKRTFETSHFYLLGWVSDAEFADHLDKLKNPKKRTR